MRSWGTLEILLALGGRFLLKLALELAGNARSSAIQLAGVSFACQRVDQTSTRVRGSAKKIVPRCPASVVRSWSSVTRQDSRDREARRRGLAVGLNGGFRHHLNPGWQANDPVYWSYSPCRPREIGSDGQLYRDTACADATAFS